MNILLGILFFSLLWFWWDSSGVKEIAIRRARRLCEESGVLFLDDSVALYHIRLRRIGYGSLMFVRRYTFEFCTDGQQRYAGYIEMLGKAVQRTHLEPYRITTEY